MPLCRVLDARGFEVTLLSDIWSAEQALSHGPPRAWLVSGATDVPEAPQIVRLVSAVYNRVLAPSLILGDHQTDVEALYDAGAEAVISQSTPAEAIIQRLKNQVPERAVLAELDARLEDAPIPAEDAQAHEGLPPPLMMPLIGIFGAEGLAEWQKRFEPVLGAELVSMTLDRLPGLLTEPDLRPDFTLIDARRDTERGLSELAGFRRQVPSQNMATLTILRDDAVDQVALAYDIGASDVILEGQLDAELVPRATTHHGRQTIIEQQRKQVKERLTLSVIDPLTGLHNRRFLNEFLNTMLQRARNEASEFAILVFDMDRFKRVNDKYGHAGGDTVLREFAQRLRDNVRGRDFVARLGGEEFCLAMPNTDLASVLSAAERIRKAISEPEFYVSPGQKEHLTVSVGVAIAPTQSADPDKLMEAADLALYTSKEQGRNRVTLAGAA